MFQLNIAQLKRWLQISWRNHCKEPSSDLSEKQYLVCEFVSLRYWQCVYLFIFRDMLTAGLTNWGEAGPEYRVERFRNLCLGNLSELVLQVHPAGVCWVIKFITWNITLRVETCYAGIYAEQMSTARWDSFYHVMTISVLTTSVESSRTNSVRRKIISCATHSDGKNVNNICRYDSSA